MVKNNTTESQQFIRLETIGASILFCATIFALVLSNSPLKIFYTDFFHTYLNGQIGNYTFKFNLLLLINDGLMAIFFLVVGLEIKYEILKGTLNSLRKAALPGIGALGGMIVPAMIYVAINYSDHTLLRGWPVPTATDIAFALAVLSLLGSKVHPTLKVFLTALAILDDLASILIITIFYTDHLSTTLLFLSCILTLLLFILNKIAVTNILVYLLIGFILWACFLKSGIHPALTGVIVALMIPLQNREKSYSPLQKLQHRLHPWIALGILPLFAFANAGVSFLTLSKENVHVNLILGVLLGLFFGKQIGVFGASWLAVKFGIAKFPDYIKWREIYAVSIVCGIGFTMSLFIGTLAFSNTMQDYMDSVKVGILCASLLSGVVGYVLLLLMYHHKNPHR